MAEDAFKGVTGDQKALPPPSEFPSGLKKMELAAKEALSVPTRMVAPTRGGKVITESFKGVISVAKSSGQIW